MHFTAKSQRRKGAAEFLNSYAYLFELSGNKDRATLKGEPHHCSLLITHCSLSKQVYRLILGKQAIWILKDKK
jgi:hypothetical protein